MFEDGSISFIRFFAFEWRYRCRWKNLVFSSPCLMSLQHRDRAWLSGLELHCKAKGESCIWIKMAHNDFHNKEAKRSLGYDTSINPWWGITQWRCTLHLDAPPPPHHPSAPPLSSSTSGWDVLLFPKWLLQSACLNSCIQLRVTCAVGSVGGESLLVF